MTKGTTEGVESSPPRSRVTDPAASMALIFDAMKNPLDPQYEDAAKRRAASGGGSDTGRGGLLIVACILIGLLLGVGARVLRVPSSVGADRRAQLIEQVHEKQGANDRATQTLRELRAQVQEMQASALSRGSQRQTAARLQGAEQEAGAARVSGSGFEVRLSNPGSDGAKSADGDPRTQGDADAVTSTDLQQVVNGAWQAGATAVTVNDQRVTTLSAIRFAGSAVLVNFRPLTPPYTVTVIGPSGTRDRFDRTFASTYLASMRSGGFGVDVGDRTSLEAPPLDSMTLQHARIDP